MNERIQELAKQAGYTKDMFGVGHWDMPECKKFAELIVKACGNVAWRHTPETEELEYSHLIKDKILAHFGVKE
jgi:hypothetical protein